MSQFGDVMELLAQTEYCNKWSFKKVIYYFGMPLVEDQSILFYRGKSLRAVCNYALVSDADLEALVSGDLRVSDTGWKTGSNLFFSDFVCVDNTREVIRSIQRTVAAELGDGTVGHWYRPLAERNGYAVAR